MSDRPLSGIEFMIMPLRRFAQFNGRSTRSEFWWFQVAWLIGIFVLGFVFGMLAEDDNPVSWIVWACIVLFILGMIVPGLAVTVRRLHDRNMSGLWLIPFLVVGIIPELNSLALVAFWIVMALPGTTGDNRFGPDPLQNSPTDQSF